MAAGPQLVGVMFAFSDNSFINNIMGLNVPNLTEAEEVFRNTALTQQVRGQQLLLLGRWSVRATSCELLLLGACRFAGCLL